MKISVRVKVAHKVRKNSNEGIEGKIVSPYDNG
jgi:hypothetical protein